MIPRRAGRNIEFRTKIENSLMGFFSFCTPCIMLERVDLVEPVSNVAKELVNNKVSEIQ